MKKFEKGRLATAISRTGQTHLQESSLLCCPVLPCFLRVLGLQMLKLRLLMQVLRVQHLQQLLLLLLLLLPLLRVQRARHLR